MTGRQPASYWRVTVVFSPISTGRWKTSRRRAATDPGYIWAHVRWSGQLPFCASGIVIYASNLSKIGITGSGIIPAGVGIPLSSRVEERFLDRCVSIHAGGSLMSRCNDGSGTRVGSRA